MKVNEEVERVLNVSQEMKAIHPTEALMKKLYNIPENLRQTYDRVPKRVVWSVAASIAVLVLLNIFIFSDNKRVEPSGSESLELHYFSYLKSL